MYIFILKEGYEFWWDMSDFHNNKKNNLKVSNNKRFYTFFNFLYQFKSFIWFGTLIAATTDFALFEKMKDKKPLIAVIIFINNFFKKNESLVVVIHDFTFLSSK